MRMMLQHYHNDRLFGASIFSPSLRWHRKTQCIRYFEYRCVMPVTKMITTFASVAVGAFGLFAFSWVGLALLGF